MANEFDNQKTKKAAESVVYEIDWRGAGNRKALRDSDTIATSAWAFVSSGHGMTKDNEGVVGTNTVAQVRLVGGNVGGPYQLRNTITTSASPVETLVEDLFITVE
jgi:hypothetical protein